MTLGYPHQIRLRGPWEYEPVARFQRAVDGRQSTLTNDLPPAGRLELPADWGATLGSDFRGRVRYRRRFGRPPQLDSHEQIWLVVEGVDASGSASLNDRPLGPIVGYAVSSEWDVTHLLEPRNQLELLVDLPDFDPQCARELRPGRESLSGGPVREVRLEIRSTHFVDRLSIEVAEQEDAIQLIAGGQLVGPATPDPFTLVVSGWGGELLAGDVSPGTSFYHTADIERLARGTANASDGLGGLATLSIRLLGPHGRVWEARRLTSHRSCEWDRQNAQLIIAGRRHELPVDRLRVPRPLTIEELVQTHGEESPGLLLCDTIWTESEYTWFDRAGWRLIQAIPPDWIDRVCPALAHHPSIVAWTTSAAGSDESPSPLPPGTRPWIPRGVAGDDGQ